MFYVINARITTRNGEYTSSIELPTFYLNGNVQGFTDADGAMRIARSMIALVNPGIANEDIHVFAAEAHA